VVVSWPWKTDAADKFDLTLVANRISTDR